VLGISDVDPVRYDLLFERFMNSRRDELPDIDLDVESHRREEVLDHMGIQSELRAVCSIPLGTNEVTPLEMASAYATLANDGVHCEPFAIQRIEDREGEKIFRQQKEGRCQEILDPDIATLTVNMLKAVIQSGTGTRANLGAWPAFGKTGSTNNLADACEQLSGALVTTRRFQDAVDIAHRGLRLRLRLSDNNKATQAPFVCSALLRLAQAQTMAGGVEKGWATALLAERACRLLIAGPDREQSDLLAP
jgi:hypothetical protein